MCLWCAFWCCFVRVCARFVWVSFSSFVCRSSWSFFVCVRDSEVFVSRFEFEFLFRVCSRNFRLEFSSSSSLNFRVEFWIRLFRFVALFDFSNLTLNSSSNSTSRISCRISNSKLSSKFVVEIFVSSLYLISRISLWVCCRIRLLEVRCSIRLLEFRVFDSTSRFKSLEFDDSKLSSNFEFVLIYSTSRISIRICRRNCRFRVAFFIWVLHWTSQLSLLVVWKSPICIAILSWRPQLFSHERFRFALVATRALRALFVRKILVKRQFTFSLYFGIIEL